MAPPPLSPREVEVIRLVAQGYEDKQIALALGCKKATVKTHLQSVFVKLGAKNRAHAAAIFLCPPAPRSLVRN